MPASQVKPVDRGPRVSPTPDPPRILPTPRLETEQYTVQPNDSLGVIARRYGVALPSLIAANDIHNPDYLEVGQVLTIPPAEPLPPGPDFKVIPDSELVNGPASAGFDLNAFIQERGGYLSQYEEELNGFEYTGSEVVQRIAVEYSVNPRLLLAVLEHRSGWVTQVDPPEETLEYPMLVIDARRPGLYRQLAWAANQLNRGYYLWRINALSSYILADGSVVPASPTLNAGTAGVQNFFSALLNPDEWRQAVGEQGLQATYISLFGYPFDYSVEPIVPAGLTQPPLQLPFEPGDSWSYTGGPHAGWADGSAWAAIDFAPPGPALGCVTHEAWVTAVADGVITYADVGAVVQDLDSDGLWQTGWSILYMHVESRDRIQPGTAVRAGDRIGHPSCEGGVSSGTHLHLARRYNGEWISADGALPFNLDGWVSQGIGNEYDGFLVKDGVVVEAWAGRRDENQISR